MREFFNQPGSFGLLLIFTAFSYAFGFVAIEMLNAWLDRRSLKRE